MQNLLKSLSNAKKQIGAITKETTNPFFKSKYFDINQLIEHVEPVLEANGLMLMQPLTDGKVFSQIYHVEAGEMIESSMELPQLSDPQKMGSAITYYRRYTLQSLLALQAEDDDANKASGKVKTKKDNRIPLTIGSDVYNKCVTALKGGFTFVDIEKKYVLSEEVRTALNDAAAAEL